MQVELARVPRRERRRKRQTTGGWHGSEDAAVSGAARGEGRGGGRIGGEGREAAGLEVSREGMEAVGGLGGETRELGLQPFIYYTSTITTIRSWMND
jgi:hypothetical protein